MAEPQASPVSGYASLDIEVKFLEWTRCLFLKARDPWDLRPPPPDEMLQKLVVRLQGTTPGTRRTAGRQVGIPYRVEGRIGGVPARRVGQQTIRILKLEPVSPLALAGEERIRRRSGGSDCVDCVHLRWPDGREETYARRAGHKRIFSLVTSS
ncbi:hypothetical protein EPO33_05355 [Patescibacteria group bacterium]|nr:MAG: hypothetical protein EPO33_05355 [Patescibacteria group bacterium]